MTGLEVVPETAELKADRTDSHGVLIGDSSPRAAVCLHCVQCIS